MMIGIGSAYFYSAVFIQGKFKTISDGSLPAMSSLNEIRESVWELWQIKEKEELVGQSFIDVEKTILHYRNVSNIDQKDEVSKRLRASILMLQEKVDTMDYNQFVQAVVDINFMVSQVMSAESAKLSSKTQEVDWVTAYTSGLSMLLIAVGLFGCLLPGLWLAKSVSKALVNVQKAADLIAAGDLSQGLSEEGNDEISQLSTSFNRMVTTIRQADIEITREVEDRIRAERKAQTAAKAKSDFLAHMSHEFRTPLNGILGYSQMLSLDHGLSEKNVEVVKSLQKSGESLLELINDVLDLTKIEAQKMNVQKTRFYLGDFLESLVESYSEQVRMKGLNFKIELDDNLPEDILSDQIRLRQILVNLLGNAIKFTDRGHVGISVTPIEGGLRFSVYDTGMGISPEHHADVMQPFQQIELKDRNNQGTGLGLPISNRLLEMMGSHLCLKSDLEKGSTFYFDLPQPDVKYRKLVHSPTRVTGYRGKARKILIGEEGLGTATMLMPLMQKVGFEVLHLRSADTFIEKCLFFQADVVVIDLYFGESDGVEVMRELQNEYERNPDSNVPTIFLFSDHRKTNDRERALRSGANAFLGVPIRFSDLLVAIRDELDLVWIEGSAELDTRSNSVKMQIQEDQEDIYPQKSELKSLLELTRSGNVRQLRERLVQLREENKTLSLFVDRLLVLCADYRVNAILQELEKLVANETLETDQKT